MLIEVDDSSHEIRLPGPAQTEIVWLHRKGAPAGETTRVLEELHRRKLPQGDYFAWLALEKTCAFAIQSFLLSERGAKKEWIKTTGYWSKDET